MGNYKIGVLISGRGSNLSAIISAILSDKIPAEISCVISNKASVKGLQIASNHKIPAIFIDPKGLTREEYDHLLVAELKNRGVELVCLAGFMRIISPYFVRSFPNRIMNIHPALLPSFTGLSAQKQALDYGVKVSGCTVHFVDEGCDTGPIILQKAVPILEDDTEDSLSKRIIAEEYKLYPEAISLFCQGRLRVEGRRVRIADSVSIVATPNSIVN
ncbi:phosphoribosylglycinamide formyltransferase [bacterium]|nr:phosphoribosylglycinamide formyltransferase [bacterium]MBU1599742.1 phosphoribosylglycinamide formyltransferase [bacterium]